MRTTPQTPEPAGHAAPVSSVALRADGRRLASCSADGSVVVWDVAGPGRLTAVTGLRHAQPVNAAAWNPAAANLLATASDDRTTAVWRVVDDRPPYRMAVLGGHAAAVRSVAWTPDGQGLACLTADGRVTMWTLAGAYVGEVGGAVPGTLVAVSRTGQVAVAAADGSLSVHDPWRRVPPATRVFPTPVEACGWSPDGATLAVAQDDGAVELLGPALESRGRIDAAESALRCLTWTDDGTHLVAGGYDNALYVIDPAGGPVHRIGGRRLWSRSVAVAGGLIAAGNFGIRPEVFAVPGRTGGDVPMPPDTPAVVAAAPGGLVMACEDGTVLAADTAGGSAVRPVTRVSGTVLSLAAGDGAVYAGTAAGKVVRHDDTGERSASVGMPVTALCRTPDALIVATAHGTMLALDPLTLDLVRRAGPHAATVRSLEPFRTGFLAVSRERTVVVGDLHGQATIWEHGNRVTAAAAAGDVIASSSRGLSIHVVRLGAGGVHVERRQSLPGPDEPVRALAVLGDAATPTILAASYDSMLYAWRLDWTGGAGVPAAGRRIAQLRQGLCDMVRLDERRAAVVGRDGDILFVGLSGDGDARVVDALHLDEQAAPAGPAQAGG